MDPETELYVEKDVLDREKMNEFNSLLPFNAHGKLVDSSLCP